jgi:thiamine kinase-like enzyme|eukprot:g6476.t1
MFGPLPAVLKRHFVKVGAATALAAALYKFNSYAAVDHVEGQHYGMAMLQTAYWIVREQCGLVDQQSIPFKEEDITVATIQHCLRKGGKVPLDVKVQRISIRRLSSHSFETRAQTYCVNIFYAKGGSGPSQVFVKLFPQNFSSRLRARMRGWSFTEANFYASKIASSCSLLTANVYFCGYIPGRQSFCLVLEMLGHLPHGSPNEVRGIPMPNSIAAVRSLARLHAQYFNGVQAKGPRWGGRVYHSTRFQANLKVAQLNVDRFLGLLKDFEKDGFMPFGTMTTDIVNFYRRAVKAYLCHATARQTPKELGGEHNMVLNHGDFRGGNMLLQGESKVIVCDFQRIHENSPGVDIAVFLCSNITDPESQLVKTREILSAYYDELMARGVDSVDYPWHRMLAEVSLGFTFEALFQILCLENMPNLTQEADGNGDVANWAVARDPLTATNNTERTSTEHDLTFEAENIICLFTARVRRTVALVRAWNTSKFMELAMETGSSFPKAELYVRWLPEEMLEDGFHPASLSF